jgi:hypothetical protein
MSEETTHKAHHPSQSGKKAGKKAKVKQNHHGFNEKVLGKTFYPVSSPLTFSLRHSLPDQDAELKDKVVVPQKKTKPASMFPSLTVPLMTSLRRL